MDKRNHILTPNDLGHPHFQKPPEETTVIVGMSGGVDSSVSAALLKDSGYRVIGMFMKNWEEQDENGVCQASKEYQDVVRVCEQLDIPYYSVEFVKEYRDQVFQQFLNEYKLGYTPNPDILCNREIKFNVFLKHALNLGADFLATGHYCQNKYEYGKNHLYKGEDPGKDQSYFLYTVNSEILKNVVFPLGHLQKSEVRDLAQKYKLSTSHKKDSTGICFIGERNFRNFLSQYINDQEGSFCQLNGEVVGRHIGAAYYTLGQRKGLGLGGPGAPWFVVGKDVHKNIVYVERGEKHPALFTDDLTCNEFSWVDTNNIPKLPAKLKAKVRYRQADQDCTLLEINEKGEGKVLFDRPQRAVTPRQSIVFYDHSGTNCLGGAMIKEPGPSYETLNKSVENSLKETTEQTTKDHHY